MPNIFVRNVPEDTHARLAGRAEAAGVSLQQYVLDLLDLATARMTTQEAVAMLRSREERAEHLDAVLNEARARRGRVSVD